MKSSHTFDNFGQSVFSASVIWKIQFPLKIQPQSWSIKLALQLVDFLFLTLLAALCRWGRQHRNIVSDINPPIQWTENLICRGHFNCGFLLTWSKCCWSPKLNVCIFGSWNLFFHHEERILHLLKCIKDFVPRSNFKKLKIWVHL